MTEPRTQAKSPYDWTNVPAAWHHWHHGDCLSPETPESAARRIHEIVTIKPKKEQAERLLRFRPADISSLPVLVKAYAACVKANVACVKANAAYDKAYAAWVDADAAFAKAYAAFAKASAAYDKATAARVKAYAANLPAILALHAEQCGCRWTPESPSIFEDHHD